MAGLVLLELAALTILSRHRHPPIGVLLLTFGIAFAAYLAILPLLRQHAVPLWVWFLVAFFLRLPWIVTGVSLSDDIWRYLHDGRAQLAGVNPFQFPPSAPEAAAYAGPERPLINNPDLPTIYPPFAQLTFRAAAALGATVLSWKLVLMVFDLGIGVALAYLLRWQSRSPHAAAVYLLHPLPVIEFAGNGHVDAVAIFALVAALAFSSRRAMIGGAALAVSVATKYLALPLAPFLVRPLPRHARVLFVAGAAGAILLSYLPFLDPLPIGSLGTFARTFEFNGPIYTVITTVTTKSAARWFIGALLLAVLGWLWSSRREPDVAAFVWIAAVLLLSPIVHPWYVTWLVPFLALRRENWALAWSGSVVLAYTVLPRWWSDAVWELPWRFEALEYLPVFVLLGMRLLRSRAPSRPVA